MNSTILKQSDSMMSIGMASMFDVIYNKLFSSYYINAMLSRESTVIKKLVKAHYYNRPIKITVAKTIYNEGYQAKDSVLMKIAQKVEKLGGTFKIEKEKLNIPGASDTLLLAKGNDILSSRTFVVVTWK